ncbi:MAG TPA: LPXTG cell wall anchor domain-containing protein [Patescibacteria group bacterium]|nr:LPXTG cell wall anchor domain-containing protein [Patescibacteria group bacterium]
MYGGKVLGASTATLGTAAAITLPNTGSNVVVTIALSVAAGLVTWGIMQARARRQNAKG